MKKHHHLLYILELRALYIELNLFNKSFHNYTCFVMRALAMARTKEAPQINRSIGQLWVATHKK
jgi:hypothetical protein